MPISKVVFNNSTLIDLTADTVAADKLLLGYTAHGSDGSLITGTYEGISVAPHLVIIAAAGSTITVTKDGSSVTPTQTTGSTTMWECNLPSFGTWIVSDGSITRTVDVTKVQEYTVDLTIPDGKTVTPTANVQTWLSCAGIHDKSYTTLSEVFTDQITMSKLYSDENASDYLKRSTSWTSSITGNASSMTMIGNNNYCSEDLLSDSTWLNAICSSSNYAKILKETNPTMTGTDSPSGNHVGANNSLRSDLGPTKAFDGSSYNLTQPTFWIANNPPGWIWYGKDYMFSVFRFKFTTSNEYAAKNNVPIELIASNDATNWTSITTFYCNVPYYQSGTLRYDGKIDYETTSNYRYWGFRYQPIGSSYAPNGRLPFSEIHFYGRVKYDLV